MKYGNHDKGSFLGHLAYRRAHSIHTLGVSKEGWRGSGLSPMENTVFPQLLGD